MKCRAVLITNDEKGRSLLRELLASLAHRVEVVGEATAGPAAVELMRATSPHVVFLDIDLPGLDAFELLARVERRPAVIFMTAFNQPIDGAFGTYVVEYIQKPIDVPSLERALENVERAGPDGTPSLLAADASLPPSERYLSRLPCRVGDRTVLLEVSEISYFQSSKKLTAIHSAERDFLVDTSLVELEKRLNPRDFIRIHRATLVNLAWVGELRRLDDGRFRVLLKDPQRTELRSSRMYAENLRKL